MDPRVEAYARLLVERCIDVRPGQQVLIRSTPLARPLIEEIGRLIAARGAYLILRLNWSMWPLDYGWAAEAPAELLGELPEIDRHACDHMDARMTIDAPENTREGADLPPERLALVKAAERVFFRRTMSDEIPWVGCQFPTQALAQDAGMTLPEFEDLLYRACLIDWDAEGDRMRRLAERFASAEQVRLAGPSTDLTIGVEGRTFAVDDGRNNMPGGEFFTSPLEDTAQGVIEFSEFPAVFQGHEFAGIRLEFRDGRVVDATSQSNEGVLVSILDRDEGARRIGELGIGCNPGIQRFMRNALFDEKIDGSAHVALGAGYPKVGGTNVSAVHWDIVKDLRRGGRIELDGAVVQEDGRWLI
jgi:aminopeptidase